MPSRKITIGNPGKKNLGQVSECIQSSNVSFALGQRENSEESGRVVTVVCLNPLATVVCQALTNLRAVCKEASQPVWCSDPGFYNLQALERRRRGGTKCRRPRWAGERALPEAEASWATPPAPSPPSLPRPLHTARAGLRRKSTEGGDGVSERRRRGSGSRGSSAAVAPVSRPDACWLTRLPLKLAKAGPQSELPQYLDPQRGRCRQRGT